MNVRCTGPVHLPSPFAQPQRQQPRPRGWHGARRGPEGKYDSQDTRVCCPAIVRTHPPMLYGPITCTLAAHWAFSPAFAVCADSPRTTSAPRAAWRSPRHSREIRPSHSSSLLPCHRTHPPMRQGPSQPSMLPCTSPPSSFLRSITTPPRPRLKRDSPFPACAPDESRARTAHKPPAHTQSTLLACRSAHTLAATTHARTPRGPRPRPPLPTRG